MHMDASVSAPGSYMYLCQIHCPLPIPAPVSVQVISFFLQVISNKGLSIYYVIQNRGEGSSQFIAILHRGALQSLLQFCRFSRNMEGLRPLSVLHIFLCSAKSLHFTGI